VLEENIKLSSDARNGLRDKAIVGGYLGGAADADAAERGFDAREQRRGRGDVEGSVRLLEHGERLHRGQGDQLRGKERESASVAVRVIWRVRRLGIDRTD
jgi:hypothetical protein